MAAKAAPIADDHHARGRRDAAAGHAAAAVGDGDSFRPSDPSGLFPTVGPAPSPSTSAPLGLPPVKPHKTIRVADAAATVPLDSRLIGGQLAGLAVLIGAVVLAIARLSLRTPKPAEDKGAGKPPAS